jgi:hypothetical protein
MSVMNGKAGTAEHEAYYYGRYSVPGRLHNVEKRSQQFKESFTFVKTLVPMRKTTTSSLRPSELWSSVPEVLFKADTLYAALSPSKGTLFQKTRSPFTKKDVDLRKRAFELYPFKYMGIGVREPQFEDQEPNIREKESD